MSNGVTKPIVDPSLLAQLVERSAFKEIFFDNFKESTEMSRVRAPDEESTFFFNYLRLC